MQIKYKNKMLFDKIQDKNKKNFGIGYMKFQIQKNFNGECQGWFFH